LQMINKYASEEISSKVKAKIYHVSFKLENY